MGAEIDQINLPLSSDDRHTSTADASSSELLSAGRFESLAVDNMCRPEIAAVAGGHSAYVPHACLANCSSLLGPRICTCPGPDNHMGAPRSPSPSPLFVAAIKAAPSFDSPSADIEPHLAGEDSGVDTADAEHHHSAALLMAELEALKARLVEVQSQSEETTALRSELSAAQHASDMEAVRAGHAEAMAALKESHTAAVDAAAHAHAHELRSANEFFTQQLNAAKQELHAAHASHNDYKASCARELNTIRESHAQELISANNTHSQALETAETRHAEDMAAVKDNHTQELEAVKTSHAHELSAQADKIRSLQCEADALRSEIADTYKPQVEELRMLKARLEQEAAERRAAEDAAAAAVIESNKHTGLKKHGSLTGKLTRSIGDQARKVERDMQSLKRKLTFGKKAHSTDAPDAAS